MPSPVGEVLAAVNYFAYGSNMLTRRLADPSRAPSAVACGMAVAPGFVVRFHKIGADGSGKCTLVAMAGESEGAHGVLYDVSDADCARLDRVEGVHTGGYVRRSVELRLTDDRTETAMTYVAGARYVDAARVPFDWYRDLVVAGAIEHRLPASYVDELMRAPVIRDPDPTRAARAYGLLKGP